MSFGAPELLYLLLILPVTVWLHRIIFQYSQTLRRRFQPATAPQPGNPSTPSGHARQTVWFVLGCAGLIAAAAEPQIEERKQQEVRSKINVVFLLDTSLSMKARDIAPSRMERATEVIYHLVLRRDAGVISRFGLVSFAGSSMIVSFLTDDPANIRFYLNYLKADLKPSYGTDIGAGIQNGLLLVDKEQSLDATLTAKSVIFILISDGEDTGSVLREAVQKAVEKGIRTYAVGFGSRAGGYIPMAYKDGQTEYLTDESGNKVLATFDEGTLRWVAEVTGGRYYRSYSGAELYESLNKILANESRVVGFQKVTEKTPVHTWFLMAGFAMLSVFLIDKR